jgi:WD40 repeat protein
MRYTTAGLRVWLLLAAAVVAWVAYDVTTAVTGKHASAITGEQAGTRAASLQDPDSQGATSVAFSPGGTSLAIGDENGSTYLWNPSTGKLIRALSYPPSAGPVYGRWRR